jgi:hypothetical protein
MDPVPAGHSAHIHVLVSSRSRGHSSWTQAMSSSTTKSVCNAHRHSAYATPARRHGLPVLMEQTLCPHEVQHAVVAVDLPRHGAVDRHSLVGEANRKKHICEMKTVSKIEVDYLSEQILSVFSGVPLNSEIPG